MSPISSYQRIPPLQALALEACIGAESSQAEPMEIDEKEPLNSVSSLGTDYWEKLKKHPPHGPLGIRAAMRQIEQEIKQAEQQPASEIASTSEIPAPLSSSSSRLPRHCKVTELFRQLTKLLNEELQKNCQKSLQAGILYAPEQLELVQASLRQEAEQHALKVICNAIRSAQQLPEATDEEFQVWLNRLPNEAPGLNIDRLALTKSRLQALPDEIRYFQGIQKLLIGRDFFSILDEPLHSLRYLPESICNLINLTELDVSSCELEELPESFHHLINLQELSLNNNHLDHLPESFGNLTRLIYLDLSHNDLEKLPESFGNLTNLGNDPDHGFDIESSDLDLKDNCLEELPESFGNLVHLHMLELDHNQLRKLPQSFVNLADLVRLNLSSNYLQALPSTFEDLANLIRLDLSSNEFKQFPSEVVQLTDLDTLDLSDNKLESIPSEIASLRNLETLRLAYNSLTELPKTFILLTSLEVLHLESNKFCQFPDPICKIRGLEQIYFHHNNITMLPNELKNLNQMEYCKFEDNPLLLISNTKLKKTDSLSKLLDHQSDNLRNYKPLSPWSALLQVLARGNIPLAQMILDKNIGSSVRDRVLSIYQPLAAQQAQESNSSSSSSSSSSASSQTPDPIHPLKYPSLLGHALRLDSYRVFDNLSQPVKEAVISKVQELAAAQNAPLEEQSAEAFDANLLRLVDAMALTYRDLKRKATNLPAEAPESLEAKRMRKD